MTARRNTLTKLLPPAVPGAGTPATNDQAPPMSDAITMKGRALVRRVSGAISISGVKSVSPTGLVLKPDLKLVEWKTIGGTLRMIDGAVRWWIGDWLNYGEREYGKKYKEALDETGYAYQTLANIKYVSGRFGISQRRENLSWSHHAVIAALESPEQDEWLDRAEQEGWSVKALRKQIAEHKSATIIALPEHEEASDGDDAGADTQAIVPSPDAFDQPPASEEKVRAGGIGGRRTRESQKDRRVVQLWKALGEIKKLREAWPQVETVVAGFTPGDLGRLVKRLTEDAPYLQGVLDAAVKALHSKGGDS